jgi:hypothetical protein
MTDVEEPILGMPYSFNAIADKHPDVRPLVERLYRQSEQKSAQIASLQGDNEVLRLQLAAKRSTFVDAEVDALQEELGRVRGALRAGADIVSGT